MADPRVDELLGRIQSHLKRASDAAEGLRAQSPAQRDGDRRPPPAGWEVPGPDGHGTSLRTELELVLGLLASLRDRVPPELQHHLTEALREVLLSLRALLDWCLARTKEGAAEGGSSPDTESSRGAPGTRDIPIL